MNYLPFFTPKSTAPRLGMHWLNFMLYALISIINEILYQLMVCFYVLHFPLAQQYVALKYMHVFMIYNGRLNEENPFPRNELI